MNFRGLFTHTIVSMNVGLSKVHTVVVWWIMTPCSPEGGYLCCRGTCCIHPQGSSSTTRKGVCSKLYIPTYQPV